MCLSPFFYVYIFSIFFLSSLKIYMEFSSMYFPKRQQQQEEANETSFNI